MPKRAATTKPFPITTKKSKNLQSGKKTTTPSHRKNELKIWPARNPRTIVVQERFNSDRLQIAIAVDEDDLEIAKIKSYARVAKSHSLRGPRPPSAGAARWRLYGILYGPLPCMGAL